MKQKLSELSVFFPAYNEAGNIEEAVKQALSILPKIADKFEILIVNDGSCDATLPIAKRLSRKYKCVRVVSQRNRGYGGALKLGFKSVKYDWIFYTDSDLQFDIVELKKFIKYTNNNDVIIGFRKNRAEGIKRLILAYALKIWNKIFLTFPLRIRDIDCAFKLIHKRVLNATYPLISDGAMVSTELLLKAYRQGFTFKQIGVNHYLRRTGHPTGNSLKVIFKAIQDTFILQKHFIKTSHLGQFTLANIHYVRKLQYKLLLPIRS